MTGWGGNERFARRGETVSEKERSRTEGGDNGLFARRGETVS